MNVVFYLSALVALVCTVLVISSSHAVHALLYLIVSLFAVALIFFVLGAPFAAALEVIVYAGAIMVLFVFVVMLLNLGDADKEQERRWLSPKLWVGPSGLALILFGELVYVLSLGHGSLRSGCGSNPATGGNRDVRSVPPRCGTGIHVAPGRTRGSVSSWPAGSVVTHETRRGSMMASIPMEHGLFIAALLFSLGLIGVLVRRNIIFILMSIEVMLNAAALAFVVAGSRWGQADGQVMFIFILTMAAAEVAIGLALVLQFYKHFKTLDVDAASRMRG